MNKNVELISKFQKDFDNNLKVYSSLHIDGNISDFQAIYLNNNDKKTILFKSLEDFLLEAYGDEYLIISYDCNLSADHRFKILNSLKAIMLFYPEIGDREKIARILFLKDLPLAKCEKDGTYYLKTVYGSNTEYVSLEKPNPYINGMDDLNLLPDFSASEMDDNSTSDKSFDYASFEEDMVLSHSNEGCSVDFAKITSLVSEYLNIKGVNDKRKPFMFVFTTTSLSSIVPGNVNNSDELQMYTNIYHLEKVLDELNAESDEQTGDKLVLFMNKSNDIPAWLGTEERNNFMKSLHITLPDKKIRNNIISSKIEELSKATKYFKDYKYDSNKDKFLSLSAGYSIRTLNKLFEYIEENDSDLIDNNGATLDPKKVVSHFENGLPDNNPWEDEDIFSKVANFKNIFNEKLIGQNEAADQISSILSLAVTGADRLINEHAPQVILFLAGPTGTGKTEACKILAELLFGSSEKMHRFDMSEYSQSNSDQRLFGAPPGYVGYEEGGQLTNAARNDPFSLFLFDEIEKADSKIFDKFLQVLSDGRMTDGQGRTVSFENSIIVMTSNKGIQVPKSKYDGSVPKSIIDDYDKKLINPAYASDQILSRVENNEQFTISNDKNSFVINDKATFYDHLNRFVKTNLSYFFSEELGRKEIYGRIVDSIVVYNYISDDAMKVIIDMNVTKYVKFYKDSFNLIIDDANKNIISQYLYECSAKSENRSLGGRGIIKGVKQLFGSVVANYITNHKLKNGSKNKEIKLNFRVNDENLEIIEDE